MRRQSKKIVFIQADAESVLGRKLTALEAVRGLDRPDSRTVREKVDAAARKPVPLSAHVGPVEAEARRLEEKKAAAKYLKLGPDERSLHDIRVYQAKQDAKDEAPGEHFRLESVREIADRIAFDPTREAADLELAELVLAQHGNGMDPAVADAWFAELTVQEQRHLDGVEAAIGAERAVLEARLAGLGKSRAALPSDSQRFNLLKAARHRGLPMAPEDHAAFDAAENDPVAQTVLAAKYASQILAYEASVASGEVQ